jgi:hypothetical protein
MVKQNSERKNMKIPNKIRVGRKKYRVEKVEKIKFHRPVSGRVDYWDKVITLATHSVHTKKPHPPAYMSESFWHELTHAILYDMGHGLARNESFVTRFSSRLNNAILSAEV